jgi:hypothetical protein
MDDVRRHLEEGDWSAVDSDLTISRLRQQLTEMEHRIKLTLVHVFGINGAGAADRLREGKLEPEESAGVWAALSQQGVSDLASEALAARRLFETAYGDLAAYAERRLAAGDDGPVWTMAEAASRGEEIDPQADDALRAEVMRESGLDRDQIERLVGRAGRDLGRITGIDQAKGIGSEERGHADEPMRVVSTEDNSAVDLHRTSAWRLFDEVAVDDIPAIWSVAIEALVLGRASASTEGSPQRAYFVEPDEKGILALQLRDVRLSLLAGDPPVAADDLPRPAGGFTSHL